MHPSMDVAVRARALAGAAVPVLMRGQFRPLPASDVLNRGLPASVESWYRSAGPDGTVKLKWYAESLMLFGPSDLADAQIGYAVDVDGHRISDWKREWLVIGTLCGDPILLNSATGAPGDGPVMTDIHGSGRWDPVAIAPSLGWFLWGLELLCGVLAHIDPREWVDDETLTVHPTFSSVQSEIAKFLGAELGRRWVTPGWALDGFLPVRE